MDKTAPSAPNFPTKIHSIKMLIHAVPRLTNAGPLTLFATVNPTLAVINGQINTLGINRITVIVYVISYPFPIHKLIKSFPTHINPPKITAHNKNCILPVVIINLLNPS